MSIDMKEHYKGYTIESYYDGWHNTFRAYPTEEGVQDDADFDGEDYKYTGNCIYGSIENLKSEIDEKD